MEVQVPDILDHISDALYIVDEHWRITYVNRKVVELLGRHRHDLLGKNVWEEFPQAIGSPEYHAVLGAMRERRSIRFQYLASSIDRWIDLHAYPIGVGLAVHFTDIHDRKLAEVERERLLTELEESQHLFQRIAETSPDALYVYDLATGLTTYLSPRSEQVTGYTPDELRALGDRFAAILHSDDLPGILEHRRMLYGSADGEVHECEYRIRQRDGTYRWLRSRATAFARGEDRQVRQIVGITQDITARKQAEEALRRAHDELEARVAERTRELAERNERLWAEIAQRERAEQARQQLLQQLVSMQEDERRRLSHELHDSLGQYLTALHLGLKSAQARDDCSIGMADTLQHLRDLALLIDDALDHISFELRPPGLDDLGLDAALRVLVKEWSATSNIPVDIHTSMLNQERLPATVETTVYRIVQEALTNVFKHAQATRVSLIVKHGNGEVHAIVEDDGCGFDLDAVMHTPSAQRQIGVKGMAERAGLAGGRLDIETALGAGTTLYLHIPLHSEASNGEAVASNQGYVKVKNSTRIHTD